MAEYRVPPLIRGSGGGGKGGGSSRVAEEDPNTLRSKNVASIIDLLGEGPIWGLVDGLKSVILDGVAVQNSDNSFNYNGLILMTRQGYPDQSALPGPHNIQTEYAVSKEVRKDAPIVEGFTNAQADIINVKMQLQALSFQDKETGDLRESTVAMAIDVRNGVNGNWQTVVSRTIKGKTTSPYQRQWKIRLPAGNDPEWFVRMRRLTDDDQGTNYSNDIYFSSMTVITEAKLTYPDSALIGIKADASQFGTSIPDRAYHIRGLIINVPSNYNPITREYTGTWNGTFKKAWTDNPAWILYDMVTNTRYGAKQTQFDKWGLYSIGQYCDELVPDGYGGMEPRFTCNVVITAQEDAYAAIDTMASVFRGMIYWASSEISAVADRPGDPVRLFTKANVIDDFVRQGTSMKARHSVVLVTWNDPEDSYQKTIEMVTDQEMIEKWGWRQTEITQFGCTSRGQARRAGKWLMYTEKYETETISFKGTSDAMDLRPGNIIQVSDPAVSGVRLGGRLKTEGTSVLELDRLDGIDTSGSWSLTVTLPSGGAETRAIASFDGTEVTLESPLSDTPVVGAVWTISSDDVKTELFRVISLSDPGVEMQPSITAVAHNPGKYAMVEEDIPLPARPTSLIPTGRIQPPTGLTAVSHTYLEAGRKAQGITVSWTPAEDGRVVSHRLEVMGAGDYSWSEVYSGSGVSYTLKNSDAGDWSFRVKSVDGIGASSVWVYLVETVQNRLAPTPPTGIDFIEGVLSITVKPQGDMVNQMWEVRRSNVPLATADIESNGFLVGLGTQLYDSDLRPLTTYYYYARGTNAFGVSDWVAAQAETRGTADAYLELLNGELSLTELNFDLQEEIGKISGVGEGSVNDRINTVNERLTGIKEDLEAADSGYASDIERIDAAVDAVQTYAQEESSRLDLRADDLQDSVDDIQTDLNAESVRLDAAIDAAMDTLGDEVERLDTDIADVIAAADIVRENLEGEVTRLDGKVDGVEQAASDARDQINATATEIQQRVDAADQAILEESRVRESGDMQSAQQLTALTSKAGESQSRITALERTSAELDALEAIQFAAIEATKAGAAASIGVEETARVEGDEALAQIITTLTARVGTNEASITTVDQARVDSVSALSSRISELSAKLDSAPTFVSGWEAGTDYDQWTNTYGHTMSASTTQYITGNQAAKIRSNATPTPSGTPQGIRATIPAGTTSSFSGYELTISVYAKQDPDTPSAEFAMAYSAGSDGDSGWNRFTPTNNWEKFEFTYAVPEGSQTNHYISLWADTAASNKAIFVDSLTIRQSASDVTDVTAAIEAEQQARADADVALASSITALEADFQGVNSAITQEQQARADAVSALASDITALESSLEDAEASITSEAATRLSKDNALATRASNLESRMGSAESSITSEEEARADADEALSTRINSANSRIDASNANISSEATTRANADSALASDISALTAALEDAEASVTSEAQARADADSALATDITELSASIDDVESSVTSEAQARVSGDNALATRASNLETRMGDAEAGITSEAQARADAVSAVVNSVDAIEARLDDSGGTIVDEATIRAKEDEVLAQTISTVAANLGDTSAKVSALQRVTAERDALDAIQFSAIEVTKAGASASVRAEEQARVDETEALASRATSLETRMGQAESSITNESQARSSADTALTNQINSANSRIDDAESSISSEASTRASADATLTSNLETANSRIDNVKSSIESESLTRANKDATLTNQINSANSRIDDNEAAITSEASTRASKDTALTNQISAANSRIDDAEASITSEASTRVSEDNALSTRIDSVNTRVGNVESSVTSEASARSNADSSLSSRIDSVVSKANSNESAISSEASTRASADSAISNRVDTVESQAASATAAVQEQLTSAVITTSAVSNGFMVGGTDSWGDTHIGVLKRRDGSTLDKTMPTEYCAIFLDQGHGTTRHVLNQWNPVLEGDQLSCSFMFARVGSADGTVRFSIQYQDFEGSTFGWTTYITEDLTEEGSLIWRKSADKLVTVPAGAVAARVIIALASDNTSGRAAFTAVKAERVDAALSEKIDTVQVDLGQSIASVQTTATAQYNNVDGRLRAKWGVVLDNNGYVSGWGQENDGNTSTTIFRTDRLAVAQPGKSSEYIFVVDGNQTVMKEALIGSLTFTKLKDASGSFIVSGGKLKAEYIQADQLEVEYGKIRNVVVRNSDLGNAAVDTLQIAGQAVTLPSGTAIGGSSNSQSIGGGPYVTVVTHSFTSTGASTIIMLTALVRALSGTPTLQMQVLLDNQELFGSIACTIAEPESDTLGGAQTVGFNLVRGIPAGNHILSMRFKPVVAEYARAEVIHRAINVLELKR